MHHTQSLRPLPWRYPALALPSTGKSTYRYTTSVIFSPRCPVSKSRPQLRPGGDRTPMLLCFLFRLRLRHHNHPSIPRATRYQHDMRAALSSFLFPPPPPPPPPPKRKNENGGLLAGVALPAQENGQTRRTPWMTLGQNRLSRGQPLLRPPRLLRQSTSRSTDGANVRKEDTTHREIAPFFSERAACTPRRMTRRRLQ